MSSRSQRPRISVLTPSYNQAQFIEQNILSVMGQNYPDTEHIVIDGGSTDGTVDILRKYSHVKWISEKDKGQADALNKGLALSTGDIIGWINSDDYYEKNTFQAVAGEFDGDSQWVIGEMTLLIERTGATLRVKSPPITYESLIDQPDDVRQQGAFYLKCAIESVGGWNPDLHMVMDYDLWIRLAKRSTPRMVARNWAYFRIHDDQKTSYRNILIQTHEIADIQKKEGVSLLKRSRFLGRRYLHVKKGALKAILVESGIIDAAYARIPLSIHTEQQMNRVTTK